MLIKLDSIEEESALLQDNPHSKRQKSKNNKMDEWNNELNLL